MAWCFDDEVDEYGTWILESLETQTALVPRLWHLEVSNVLLVGERRKRISAEKSNEFLQLLQAIDIQTDSASSTIFEADLMNLARKHQLSSYDAVYLALAICEKLPIATQDKNLRNAARAQGLFLEF